MKTSTESLPLLRSGKVLGVDLPWMKDIGRPRHTRGRPVVLTPDKVARILTFLDGEHRPLAQQEH